jgi:17beta-estradiol 17-dehydrogenase / very-long-chain 3-oxoacyl-CoA reductase
VRFLSVFRFGTAADLCITVNNVGKSHAMPVDFVETPLEEIDAILAVNIHGTLAVTKMLVPGMVARCVSLIASSSSRADPIFRKRGLVLNVGSFSGAIASPMLAAYSGSKAFLQTFSDALAAELAPAHVRVQCLNTYFVVSSMSKIRRASALIPTPAAYVRACLARIGSAGGAAYTGRPSAATLYPTHALLDYALGVLSWKSVVIRYTHALHKDIRRRALRKAEREAKKQ